MTEENKWIIFISDPSNSLKSVPIDDRTQEVCEKAVEIFSSNIKYVPEKYLTKKMCKNSIIKNPWNIEYIPDKFMTRKLAKLALKGNINTSIFINNPYYRT